MPVNIFFIRQDSPDDNDESDNTTETGRSNQPQTDKNASETPVQTRKKATDPALAALQSMADTCSQIAAQRLHASTKPPLQTTDADTLFGQYVAAQLKMSSDELAKARARHEISGILLKLHAPATPAPRQDHLVPPPTRSTTVLKVAYPPYSAEYTPSMMSTDEKYAPSESTVDSQDKPGELSFYQL